MPFSPQGESLSGFSADHSLPSDHISQAQFDELLSAASKPDLHVEVADPLSNLSEKELRKHGSQLLAIIRAQQSGARLARGD